jgi:hypothetical protein
MPREMLGSGEGLVADLTLPMPLARSHCSKPCLAAGAVEAPSTCPCNHSYLLSSLAGRRQQRQGLYLRPWLSTMLWRKVRVWGISRLGESNFWGCLDFQAAGLGHLGANDA